MSRTTLNIALAIRTDGMAPGIHSMVDLAAVVVEPGLTRRFSTLLAPATEQFNRDHLARHKLSRNETFEFPAADGAVMSFYRWFNTIAPETERFRGLHVDCWAFEPSFDYGFISHYLHRFVGRCPIEPTVRRIGDYRAGLFGGAHDPEDWQAYASARAETQAEAAAATLLDLLRLHETSAPALRVV